MDFSSNSQQILTEEELKARFRSRELFSFAGFLSRKGEEKSYLEKKKTTYFLNIVGFFSGSILRILAGFMAVSGFMAAIFFGSELAGAAVAVVALLALEYLQLRNATELYETWFYKNKIVKGCLFFGILYSAITAFCAFQGVDDTIKFLSESVTPFSFNESAVNPTLLSDIDKADKDAKEFYTARSWKGKLDGKDAKRYNELKAEAAQLRKQYREEVQTAKLNARSDYDNRVAGKNQDDADNRFYLTLLILFTEVLFWFAFYHKERYEFLASKELELMGKIQPQPSPTPSSQAQVNSGQQLTSMPVAGQPIQNGHPVNFP